MQIYHCYNCRKNDCQIEWCHEMRKILGHVKRCNDNNCYYPMCFSTKCIIEHNILDVKNVINNGDYGVLLPVSFTNLNKQLILYL